MAKRIIRTGTTADPTGDSLKNAFVKVNDNFTELYNALGLDADTLNIGAFEFTGSVMTTTDSSAIVIDQATTITSNLSVGGDILPQTALGGDLGSSTLPWRSLYVSNNTIYIGGVPLSLEPGTNELRVNNVPISQNISYADIPNAPTDVADLTDNDGLLGGGGLSITDFGLGFTDALDAGKITTSKLYNENPNQGLNIQYTLEVTNGGVVALPDGSVINGATLKTVPGNYAGITAGPVGKDEDSWMWVDNDGAWIATDYSDSAYTWHFDNNGLLTLPNGASIGSSGSLSGIPMTTDRGTVLFGNSPECLPTLLTHFHIMKDDPANVDLFLGDDNNYVKLPGSGETAYGVEIGTNVGSAYTWRFGTDGVLTLPNGSTIGDNLFGDLAIIGVAGKNIGLVSSGVGDGYDVGSSLIWVDSITEPTKIAGVTANNPLYVGAGDVGIVTGDYLYTGNTNVWNFGADGALTLPGDIRSEGNINIEINLADSTLRRWQFGEDGALTFPDATVQTTAYTGIPGPYADDEAAALAGVALGSPYHKTGTGGQVFVRLTSPT